MEKNEKRTYLSPETEVVRFSVDDIITTSNEDNEGSLVGDNEHGIQSYSDPDPFL